MRRRDQGRSRLFVAEGGETKEGIRRTVSAVARAPDLDPDPDGVPGVPAAAAPPRASKQFSDLSFLVGDGLFLARSPPGPGFTGVGRTAMLATTSAS